MKNQSEVLNNGLPKLKQHFFLHVPKSEITALHQFLLEFEMAILCNKTDGEVLRALLELEYEILAKSPNVSPTIDLWNPILISLKREICK